MKGAATYGTGDVSTNTLLNTQGIFSYLSTFCRYKQTSWSPARNHGAEDYNEVQMRRDGSHQ